MELITENITSFFSMVALISFSVVGTLQGVKNFFKNVNVCAWIYTVFAVGLSFLFTFLLTDFEIKAFFACAILTSSVSQVFYELIYQKIEKAFKGAK